MSVIKNGCVMRVIWLCYKEWLCYESDKEWLYYVSDKERLCYESDLAVL